MGCLNLAVEISFGTRSGCPVIGIAEAIEQTVLQIGFSQHPLHAGDKLKSQRKNCSGQLV